MRLIYHNCETLFPVVHDEIANIDTEQFDWWLADLTEALPSIPAVVITFCHLQVRPF